jgi:hypothetical protein
MLAAFIISSILLISGILLMGMKIFFTRNGSFPNIHIGGNTSLKNKGISCATTQDREARKNAKKITYNELIKKITE